MFVMLTILMGTSSQKWRWTIEEIALAFMDNFDSDNAIGNQPVRASQWLPSNDPHLHTDPSNGPCTHPHAHLPNYPSSNTQNPSSSLSCATTPTISAHGRHHPRYSPHGWVWRPKTSPFEFLNSNSKFQIWFLNSKSINFELHLAQATMDGWVSLQFKFWIPNSNLYSKKHDSLSHKQPRSCKLPTRLNSNSKEYAMEFWNVLGNWEYSFIFLIFDWLK